VHFIFWEFLKWTRELVRQSPRGFRTASPILIATLAMKDIARSLSRPGSPSQIRVP